MLPIYETLFNFVFDSGIVPSSWLLGNINPLYKNKSDSSDPSNFRPITVLSCFGKLFTAILNERLTVFFEEYFIIHSNQSGFRKKFSTIDNIFILHVLFDLLKKKRKKFYCIFIDFAKAFDTVWRSGLWCKLLVNYVNGKMYKVILNMYKNIKSRVVFDKQVSDYLPCTTGVRQGENLSPLLFSLYINDLTFLLIKILLVCRLYQIV